MVKDNETAPTKDQDEINTHAVSGCDQGCLASAEQCIEEQGDSPTDCRAEWLKCVDNCKFLLSTT